MLKFVNANQKKFKKNLEKILISRKLNQQGKSSMVKKILLDVKKR